MLKDLNVLVQGAAEKRSRSSCLTENMEKEPAELQQRSPHVRHEGVQRDQTASNSSPAQVHPLGCDNQAECQYLHAGESKLGGPCQYNGFQGDVATAESAHAPPTSQAGSAILRSHHLLAGCRLYGWLHCVANPQLQLSPDCWQHVSVLPPLHCGMHQCPRRAALLGLQAGQDQADGAQLQARLKCKQAVCAKLQAQLNRALQRIAALQTREQAQHGRLQAAEDRYRALEAEAASLHAQGVLPADRY